jgi:hypothetical protein
MTTSFTTTDEFDDMDDGGFDEGDYPTAFGITFTPQVSGIVAGVAGLLVAGYLFISYVSPVISEVSELKKQQKEKQQQVEQLASLNVESKVQQKQAELEQMQKLETEVKGLFTNPIALETLLLNINNFVNATNITLNSYTPNENNEKKLVEDDSFGELANQKVETKSYTLDIEGSFAQIQLFLQDLERLQPLLVVKQFDVNILNEEKQDYILDKNKVIVTGEPKLKVNLTVDAVFVAPPQLEEATQ